MAKSPERWAERQRITLTRPIPSREDLISACEEFRGRGLFRVRKALLHHFRHEYTNYDHLRRLLGTKFSHRYASERDAAVRILKQKAIDFSFHYLKQLEQENGSRIQESN